MLKKIGIGIFVFLFILGLIGGWLSVIQAPRYIQPDTQMNDLLAPHMTEDKSLEVHVARFANDIYELRSPAPVGELPRLFALGEIGNQFTVLALMMLYQEDQLQLDQSVTDFYPNMPADYQPITLRMLLTHTAGLPMGYGFLVGPLPTGEDGVWPSLKSEPGTRTDYSMLGYAILRDIVARQRGEDFVKYVEAAILEPLEMTDTKFRPYTGEIEERGGWWSSLDDMKLLLQAYNMNKIVRMKSVLEIFTAPKLPNGQRARHGFGWEIQNVRGLRMESAFSIWPGTNAILVRFSEKTLVFAILSERDQGELDLRQTAKIVGEIYLGREMPQKSYRGFIPREE